MKKYKIEMSDIAVRVYRKHNYRPDIDRSFVSSIKLTKSGQLNIAKQMILDIIDQVET